MNKELIALMDIRSIIKRQKEESNFYTDKEVIDAVDQYINKYFVAKAQTNTSWKLCRDPQFHKDLETMSVSKMAMKYNCSYHGIYYHKKRMNKVQ